MVTRPERPPPTRGSGRRRGLTPTVQILRLLLPVYRINNTGSGASSEKIAQDLGKCVELKDRQSLIPRLDQLTKWWTGENTRNNSPLLAIRSRVRVVAKAADKQGDGEPPKKKTSTQTHGLGAGGEQVGSRRLVH